MTDYAIKLDGSNDYLSIGTLGNMGSQLASGFYMKFKLRTSTTAVKIWGVSNSGNSQQAKIYFNADRSTGNVPGMIAFLFANTAGVQLLGGTYIDSNFNDGKVHTIEVLIDFTIQTGYIFVDGVEYSVNYTNRNVLTTFSNFDRNFYVGAQNTGSPNSFMAGVVDDIKIGTSPSDLYGVFGLNEGTGTTTQNEQTNTNVASAINGGAAWVPGFEETPVPVVAPVGAIPAVKRNMRVYPIGINANMAAASVSTLKTWFPMMRAAGIKIIRTDFVMSQIQPTEGTFVWTTYDTFVDLAAQYGIEIVALAELYGMPSWAVGGGTPGFNHPTDPAIYKEYLRQIAVHFKGRIRFIQAGNEPNLLQYWPTGPNAAEYVAFLQAGYIGAKMGNPDVKVITAGLGSMITSGGDGINSMTYLESEFAAGMKGYYDLLDCHSYGIQPFSNAPANDNYQDSAQIVTSYRNKQLEWADDTPLVVLEWGWPTHSGGPTTEEEQAANIASFFNDILFGKFPYVQIACLYTWNDSNTGSASSEENFGILHTDLTPKPSYQSFVNAATQFANNFTEIPV